MEEKEILFRHSIPLCSETFLEDILSRIPTVSGEDKHQWCQPMWKTVEMYCIQDSAIFFMECNDRNLTIKDMHKCYFYTWNMIPKNAQNLKMWHGTAIHICKFNHGKEIGFMISWQIHAKGHAEIPLIIKRKHAKWRRKQANVQHRFHW